MSADENKATVRRWFDSFNKCDALELEECFAPGPWTYSRRNEACIEETPEFPGTRL